VAATKNWHPDSHVLKPDKTAYTCWGFRTNPPPDFKLVAVIGAGVNSSCAI